MSFFDFFHRYDESNKQYFIADIMPKWSGRFGNMIIHVMNAYMISKYYNYKYLTINKNKNYKITYKLLNIDNKKYIDDIDIIKHLYLTNPKKTIQNPYFALHTKKFFYEFNLNERIEFVQSIDDCFNLNPSSHTTNSNALYIHIRSTDIYHNTKQTCVYSQPPMSFYEKVILDNNFEHIYILSDDNNSFMVNLLLEKLGSNYCTVIEAGAKESFNILRYASNVCSSTSSFFTTACLSTPSHITKHIFTYEYLTNIYHHWFFADLYDGTKVYSNNFNNTYFHIYRINDYHFMNNVSKTNNKINIENHCWWKNSNDNFKFNWLFNDNTKQLMSHHNIKNITKIYG